MCQSAWLEAVTMAAEWIDETFLRSGTYPMSRNNDSENGMDLDEKV